MKNKDILDQEIESIDVPFSKSTTRKILIAIVVIILINLWSVFNLNLNTEGVRSLDGSIPNPDELQKALASGILFSFPILGFLSGLITSWIPFKNLSFKQKYLRFSLVGILAFEIIILILNLPKLISYLF